MKRVLVTGGDGFMGSHLVESLLSRGSEVAILVRRTSYTPTLDLRNLTRKAKSLSCIYADVSLTDWYDRAAEFAPDVIYHLAADAHVDASLYAPREVVRANVEGTLNVLEFCRKQVPSRLVVVSSSEVYGGSETPIDEEHGTLPRTPYAASKLAADRLAFSYHQAFGVPLVLIRPFNTFGPRHLYDVIPRFLQAVALGKPLRIFGSGDQQRDFMYISDLVRALLELGEAKDCEGEVFNVGTGKSTSIRELVEAIREVTGVSLMVRHEPARLGDLARLECDPSKLERRLGWFPEWTLQEGLRHSWTWVQENRHRFFRG